MLSPVLGVVGDARKLGTNPMRLEDEYRKHAADSLKLASKRGSNADKGHLFRMAEAWLDLADRIAKRGPNCCATVEHPLVERVLGSEKPKVE